MTDYSVFRKFAENFNPRDTKPFNEVVEKILSRIREVIEYDWFFDILIQGGQGMGKSTFALYVMYKHYGDPDKVLQNVFFRPEDLKNRLKATSKSELILLDDAGILLSKWDFMKKEVIDYNRLQQLARTRVKALLYTTVGSNIEYNVKENVDNIVVLHTRHKHTVYGTLYSRKFKLKTIDKTVCDFEMNLNEIHSDPVFHRLYEKYSKMREDFIEEVFDKVFEREEEKRIEESSSNEVFSILKKKIEEELMNSLKS